MKKTNFQPLWRFLFLLYCAVMLWLLFGRSQGWVDGLSYRQMLRQNMNLQPFFTIRNYLTVVLEGTNPSVFAHCLINLLGNVLLFIPAGFLFPRLFPKLRNFFLFFILCFLIMGFIELLQLFTLLDKCVISLTLRFFTYETRKMPFFKALNQIIYEMTSITDSGLLSKVLYLLKIWL